MLFGSIAVGIIATIFYQSLGMASDTNIVVLYMLLGLFSGTVGMVSYSMVKMFPAQIRFTGISFSYNVAYAIVGGLTLPLLQWLSQYSNIGAMYYIWFIVFISCLAALYYRQHFEKL